jgi:hypothetical protein
MTTFEPSSPLEQCVRAGDFEGTVSLLRGMGDAQRRSQRDSARRMVELINAARWKDSAGVWGMPPTAGQQRAARAALLLCGTAADVAADPLINDAELVALGREFSPPSLKGLVEAMLRVSPYRIRTAQILIAAGLAPRPEGDDYALGLIALPTLCGPRMGIDDFFAQDPGLKPALLRMFDIEGTGDVSLASVEKYQGRKGTSWTRILLSLCAEGVFSRATLLDKTLSALERDWPQFRAGWFSRFHAELAPTADEMRPHAARYLQLLASRIPPTVSMALESVVPLLACGAIEPAALVEALGPVMAAGSKGQIDSALKLCERAIEREPGLRGRAALAACAGLIHEAPELQRKLLQRLQAWGADDAVRAELRRYLPALAASNRAMAEALAGSGGEEAPPPVASAEAVEAPGDAPAPARPEALVPIADADQLVACIAHVFEHDTDLDEFERAVEALVRMAPLAPSTLAALGPVIKRTRKLRTPVARELAKLLLFVAQGERLPTQTAIDHAGRVSPAHALLAERIDALMSLAAQGHRVTPLSSPTHRRGFIAPAALIERARMHQARGAVSSRAEQMLALLRLLPEAQPQDIAQAGRLRDEPFTRALRHALGDSVPCADSELDLFAAAARIRHPGRDDPLLSPGFASLGPDAAVAARYSWQVTTRSWTADGTTYHHHDLAVEVAPPRPLDTAQIAVARHAPPLPDGHNFYRGWSFGGIDEALVRYGATLLPSDLGAFFAEGARMIGGNLDWWEAQWQNKAYLEPLLDVTVMPGEMGTLLICVALAGKEPGQTALAVDALVAARLQGRLDVPLLTRTLQRLVMTPLLKLPRLRKSLDAALRLAPQLAPMVVDLLAAMLPAPHEDAPKDMAVLLELLHELLVASGRVLPQACHARLAAMKLGGKGRSVQKAVLALGCLAPPAASPA